MGVRMSVNESVNESVKRVSREWLALQLPDTAATQRYPSHEGQPPAKNTHVASSLPLVPQLRRVRVAATTEWRRARQSLGGGNAAGRVGVPSCGWRSPWG